MRVKRSCAVDSFMHSLIAMDQMGNKDDYIDRRGWMGTIDATTSCRKTISTQMANVWIDFHKNASPDPFPQHLQHWQRPINCDVMKEM